MSKMIVFHTAWMDKYDGDLPSFSAGGFKYALKHGYGHEMFNFRDIDGYLYGYVPPTGNLNLKKHFGAPKDAGTIDGITVFWTAPHPEQGGRAVVGVWKDATVYRADQDAGQIARHRKVGPSDFAGYRCKARRANCVLLPTDARPIFVRPSEPRTGGSWPGQQKVFYPQSGSTAMARLEAILTEIAPISAPNSSKARRKAKTNRSSWQVDVELRKEIEFAAILAVGRRFESLGYNIKSVEKENLGYDLVATRGEECLHLEVKGRSGVDICADLSVNELKCLKAYESEKQPKAHYRIAVVTEALIAPVIHEFALMKKSQSTWFSLNGDYQLNFEERIAARVTAISTSTTSLT